MGDIVGGGPKLCHSSPASSDILVSRISASHRLYFPRQTVALVGHGAKLRPPLPLTLLSVFLAALAVSGCSHSPSGETPRAEYDASTGRLRRLEYDVNNNGRNDAVSFMDGAAIHRIELDLDENGKVDRWDFYNEDRSLQKIGWSRANDGVMDTQAFYGPDATLQRIEVSTKRDGRFDRVEFYDRGVLVRSEDDADGDGRTDKWETYVPNPQPGPGEPPYAIASAAFDDTGSGRPTRRFHYGPHGQVTIVEVDRDGDGRFEVTSRATTR